MKELNEVFDEIGNFKDKNFDPYRCSKSDKNFRLLFNRDKMLKNRTVNGINDLIKTSDKIKPMSDIVILLVSHYFASSTKGNYDATAYWR